MSSLRSTTVPVAHLDAPLREVAWQIFAKHYAGADRGRFDADLDDKQHVFLLWSGERLVGFSTVRVDRIGKVVCIYSGDTVLEEEHRGNTALQWAFFRYIAATKLRHPHRLVVWFLLTKGYKTYLLLTRNFPSCYPRRDTETPPWVEELIGTLARRRFGDVFDPDKGILHYPHERLADGVAPVDGLTDPDVRFFVERNPGHREGDELCCVGVVDRHLMLSFPVKRLRRLLSGTRR